MADNEKTYFVKGKIYWAKIVGEKALTKNYDGDGREWAYEFVPEDVTFLKEEKLLDRLKDKEDEKNPDKGDYLILRKPEFTKDGKKNDPIRLYDADDKPWGEDRLLGNGTAVDAKLRVVDWGKGKKKGIYTVALRITDLVPYASSEFGAMDGTSAKVKTKATKAKAAAEALDDLDDDIPF